MTRPPSLPQLARLSSFLDYSYADVPANLALDEALLVHAEESGGGSVLRVWESPVYAVVLGASGRLLEDVELQNCLDDNVVVARRSSGGGTVVIGPGALNVTLVLPTNYAPGLSAVDTAQAFVLEKVAETIRGLGRTAVVLGSGDLTAETRKFSGSAQRRLRNHFMVHASILLRFPIDAIGRYTKLPKRQPDYRDRRPHESFLTNLDLPRDTLVDALKSAWDVQEHLVEPGNALQSLVLQLVEEKFGRADWVERL